MSLPTVLPSTDSLAKVEIPLPQPEQDCATLALAQAGKDAIKSFIETYTHNAPTQSGPVVDPELIKPDSESPPSDSKPYVPQLPVCIIGAGVSGLYIAMMLDSLGIEYELMEGSGRT